MENNNLIYSGNDTSFNLEQRLDGIYSYQINAEMVSGEIVEGNFIRLEVFYILPPPSFITESQTIISTDEIDRADPPFEAFLLELLSDWQITIPEIGTIKAKEPPIVIITSNRTREIHDALKRRCLYHFVDYPDFEQELKILQSHIPNIKEDLSIAIIHFVKELRKIELFKDVCNLHK